MSPFHFSFTALLYYLCFALLLGMAAVVCLRHPRSAQHRYFASAALSLLVWVMTLFLFYRATQPGAVLWLGRLNFAAALPAVTFGYLLVGAISGKRPTVAKFLVVETIMLALLTALTPLVDAAELPGAGAAGRHITIYGPMIWLYLVHIVAYLTAAVLLSFREASEARSPERDQLYLVGSGMLATGLVALVTNIVLPYGFGDFHYTDVGTLSTMLFLLCVGYAILRHRLFDLKLFVRRTLVYGLLLSFALSAYSAVVVLVTERMAGEQAGTLTRVAVLMIAFSFDPLRRYLEKRVDRYLFR
jgi:hypothetical protein